MKATKKPVIAIVGETGSGKTSLAIKLAKKYNGELISADSRSIYRHLNIGTAKPDSTELKGTKLWGIDLINPDESYSVYEFQKYTKAKIAEIHSRNKIPIMVGGSGLYIDSVILNYKFSTKRQIDQSVNLNDMSIDALIIYCQNNNITLPENYKNKRFLVNTILRDNKSSRQLTPDINYLVLGIEIPKKVLESKLKDRIIHMLKNNVRDEALEIFHRYGSDIEAIKGNIYSLLKNKDIKDEDLIQKCKFLDLKLAKKQKTWFKRHKYIIWINYKNAFNEAKVAIEKKFYS